MLGIKLRDHRRNCEMGRRTVQDCKITRYKMDKKDNRMETSSRRRTPTEQLMTAAPDRIQWRALRAAYF